MCRLLCCTPLFVERPLQGGSCVLVRADNTFVPLLTGFLYGATRRRKRERERKSLDTNKKEKSSTLIKTYYPPERSTPLPLSSPWLDPLLLSFLSLSFFQKREREREREFRESVKKRKKRGVGLSKAFFSFNPQEKKAWPFFPFGSNKHKERERES